MSNKRDEAHKRFIHRILVQDRKNGGKMTKTEAIKMANVVAVRHDRKNGK